MTIDTYHKSCFSFLLVVSILSTTLRATDYDFTSVSEESDVQSKEEVRPRPQTRRKDTITTADVFALFKGEQKVQIVSKREERVQEAPATIYVVTDKEIKERGYLFLHDLLRDLPGIDFINDLGTYGMIAMQRGLDTPENNKTLIFVDGVLTNNPSQGVSYLSYQFALHNVKRVEILWGPASAVYGANAFAGIINIVTKSAEDLEAQNSLGHVSFGTIFPKISQSVAPEGIYFDFLAGGKMLEEENSPSFVVSGHYVRSDTGPNYARRHEVRPGAPALSEYYIPNSAMPILGDYNAQVRFDYQNLTLGVRAWHIFSRQGAFATYNWSATELAYWGFVGQEIYGKYTHKFNQFFSTFTQVAFRANQLPEGEYGKRPFDADRSAGGDDQGGVLLWYKRNDYAISLDQQLTLDWTANASTSIGAFAEYAKVSNWNTNDVGLRIWDGTAFIPRYPQEVQGAFNGNEKVISEGIGPKDNKPEVFYDQYNYAAYLQHSQTFFDQLKLTLGGRGDWFILQGQEGPEPIGVAVASTCATCDPSIVYTDAQAAEAGALLKRSNVYYRVKKADVNIFSFNPRFGLVWNPSHRHTLKLLHGWAFRNPTVRERFSLSGSRIPIGAALKPEQVKTTEVGYAIQPLRFLRAEIDGFYSEVKDLIQLSASRFGRPGRPTAMAQFQNIGDAQLAGFESKLDIALLQTKRLSALLFANYSFQNNRYLDIRPEGRTSLSHENDKPGNQKTSRQMPRVAEHKANVGLTLYIKQNFSLSSTLNYVGARPNVITSPINFVPAYTLVKLAASYHNPANNWEASIFVFNLLDREINDPGTRDAAGTYFSPLRPIERMTIWSKLSYRI